MSSFHDNGNLISGSVSRRSIRQLTMAETMMSSHRTSLSSRIRSTSSTNASTEDGQIDDLELDLDLDLQQQELREKAVHVINRVMDKLTGLDFASTLVPENANDIGGSPPRGVGFGVNGNTNQGALNIPDQVDKLVVQATSHENLCLMYVGWCPFW